MRSPSPRSLLLPLALVAATACSAPLTVAGRRDPRFETARPSHTVLFIHGMFMTPLCWSEWERFFQQRGYRTLAPAWPEHDAPVAEQRRRHPDAKLAALTLADVVARYRAIIHGLDEPPILVGHSMGGLVVQILLDEGLGAAGIAIDSAPPNGTISLRYSFLKSNWPVISPSAKLDEPIAMSLDDFRYAFVNGLPPDVQRAAYEKYVVPESRRVGKGPTTDTAKLDLACSRPPLLLVAGGDDHIIPASLNRSNFERYERTPAITDLREFPGRTHWTIAQEGWQSVAQYVIDWLAQVGAPPAARRPSATAPAQQRSAQEG